MSARSTVISAPLVAILGFTVVAVLQGQGHDLLGALAAILFFAAFGLILMLRWTASALFWGGLGEWLRSRWDR